MQTARSIVFKITPAIKQEMVKIIDARIREAHVTKEDFSELKNIVKDIGVKIGELATAQKRTEVKVEELATAQKRTEVKVEELATAQKELTEAQKRTEVKVEELVEAQKEMVIEVKKLAVSLNGTQKEVGGLARSFGYALENEAYRHLPPILKEKYGIQIQEKIIRAEVGGKEINIFCRARKEGTEVLVVGESKARLDKWRESGDVLEELEEKVNAVKTEYGEIDIVRVLVTHYASPAFIEKAKARGIIVVQSFEW